MDILEVIRTDVRALPTGDHKPGLEAVLQHIETAYKHLARGQSQADETAFTDAIYRTNQAFEGSAKEAYRVLAEKNPDKIRPFDIEQYLAEHGIFRERVLTQFKNYRTAWRNPSTHDHTITFDEAEAFLAIVSISAFTKLLVDEIAEKLSFLAAKDEVTIKEKEIDANLSDPTINRVVDALKKFARHYSEKKSIPIESEAQLMGALSGFFSAVLPDLEVTTGRILRTDKSYYTDIIASKGSEELIIELKRNYNHSSLNAGLQQLVNYMRAANTNKSVLFFYSGKSNDYEVDTYDELVPDQTIMVVRPF